MNAVGGQGRGRALLVDLDNTVYDWTGFFGPAFAAMAAAVADALELTVDDVIEEFADVFRRRGSVEYTYAVQELPSCARLPRSAVSDVVELARSVFSEQRRRHLHPYPGVAATLAGARRDGVRVVAVSNAPLHQARRRLERLDLCGHFDALAAWEGFGAPAGCPRPAHVRAHDAHTPQADLITWSFGRAYLKPGSHMFRHVLDELEVCARDAVAIGDSLEKDVLPAVALGVVGAWARYGTNVEPETFELLVRITPWTASEIAATYEQGGAGAVAVVDAFEQVRELLAV